MIVFLDDLCEVYIDTGRREYSGTGRNQKTTRMVAEYNNYQCIPAAINPVKTTGSAMKRTSRNSELIANYWNEFEQYSKYKVVLPSENVPACITTKNGEKTVGAIYESKNSNGALILLPDIDFYNDAFLYEDEENDELVWNDEANVFASKMAKTTVEIDRSLKNFGQTTPEPDLAKENRYQLDKEQRVRANLLKVEERIEKLQGEKAEILDQLRDLGRLRNLLFEKGKPLEYAIIDALKLLGFDVGQYHEAESEFDVVFQSKEGRIIGEAEGKDNKPINITKLRQLEMNIHEDLERENVDKPANAVLFGNAYRLGPLPDRGNPFTAKCASASERSSTALVFTPDLFQVAQYLSSKKNASFATRCRKAIIQTTGRVKFPKVPDGTTKMESKDKISDKT